MNVHFGGYDDDQIDIITEQLKCSFPTTGVECLLKVLLPEVFLRISRDALNISYGESEIYLKFLGRSLHSLKRKNNKPVAKQNKRTTKKIRRDDIHNGEECIFVKEVHVQQDESTLTCTVDRDSNDNNDESYR